jgi:CheY-like chemotaxis protein
MSATPVVLIVDDHSDIRRLLSITLGKEHHIIEAEDGVAALEAVRQHRPGMVLLDVMMPGALDGLQVLEAIKTNPQTKNTPVAMITARGQLADQNEGRALGADAYFIKPFSPLQVASWVRNHLK